VHYLTSVPAVSFKCVDGASSGARHWHFVLLVSSLRERVRSGAEKIHNVDACDLRTTAEVY